MECSIDVSVIVPARNEALHIGRLIESIRRWAPLDVSLEVIVVDNRSEDGTRKCADDLGCIVLSADGTPAAVRNAGAKVAQGRALYFIDADCEVTDQWGRELKCALDSLARGEIGLTGSWVDVPDNCTWLERVWFKPMTLAAHNHINSANMLIAARTFQQLGGFCASLVSGEDADITERATAIGAVVSSRLGLRVVHHGYPQTLRAFFRREVWHGVGDYGDLGRLLRSKTALLALLWGALAVAAVVTMAGQLDGARWLPLALAAAAFLVALISALVKYRGENAGVIACAAMVFNVYFLARFVSAFVSMGSLSDRARRSGSRQADGG